MPYKDENSHAPSHEQYFSEHRFLDICQCAFNYPKLAQPVWFTVLQELLLTEAFINPPNGNNLNLRNQPYLKHIFFSNLRLMASNVRKSFGKQFNLSSGVLDLIMKSWSEGTAKQYVRLLRRWFSFCYENELEPLNADVTSGAEFLTQYFRIFICEYSSVKTTRSALSSIIPSVNRSLSK